AILVPAGAQLPAHLLLAQLEQIGPVDLDQPRNMLLAHLPLPLPLDSDILRQEAVSPETNGFLREEDGAVPEGRHYSCPASGGGPLVLVDQAAEPAGRWT